MSLLIWRQKSFKTVLAKLRWKFTYCWINKFQPTRSVNNLNKKAENPRSGRKLTVRCLDNVDVVRDSVGRSPKNSLRRRSQEFGLSRALKDKFNQFLTLSSGLTFLKWYDCVLRLRWLDAIWIIILMGCIYFEAPCICKQINLTKRRGPNKYYHSEWNWV